MNRYYQTASPVYLDDAMYQLPYDLMQNALHTKQKEYDTAKDSAISIIDDLVINPHFKDREAALGKKEYYSNKIDDLVQRIGKDKINASSYNTEIQRLKKELGYDVTQGDVFNINENNKRIQENIRAQREKMTKNPEKYGFTSPEEVEAYIHHSYQGYKNPETNQYNAVEAFDVIGRNSTRLLIDEVLSKRLDKTVTERRKGLNEDATSYFIREWTEAGWDTQKIVNTLWSAIRADEGVMSSYRSQHQMRSIFEAELQLEDLITRDVARAVDYMREQYEKTKIKDVREEQRTSLGESLDKAKYADKYAPEVVADAITMKNVSQFATMQDYTTYLRSAASERRLLVEKWKGEEGLGVEEGMTNSQITEKILASTATEQLKQRLIKQLEDATVRTALADLAYKQLARSASDPNFDFNQFQRDSAVGFETTSINGQVSGFSELKSKVEGNIYHVPQIAMYLNNQFTKKTASGDLPVIFFAKDGSDPISADLINRLSPVDLAALSGTGGTMRYKGRNVYIHPIETGVTTFDHLIEQDFEESKEWREERRITEEQGTTSQTLSGGTVTQGGGVKDVTTTGYDRAQTVGKVTDLNFLRESHGDYGGFTAQANVMIGNKNIQTRIVVSRGAVGSVLPNNYDELEGKYGEANKMRHLTQSAGFSGLNSDLIPNGATVTIGGVPYRLDPTPDGQGVMLDGKLIKTFNEDSRISDIMRAYFRQLGEKVE